MGKNPSAPPASCVKWFFGSWFLPIHSAFFFAFFAALREADLQEQNRLTPRRQDAKKDAALTA
jgi:hypothetical protein